MTAQALELPIGRFRRFGAVGPAYQITEVIGERPDGDVLLRIRVLESGEEAEYRLSQRKTIPRPIDVRHCFRPDPIRVVKV